MTLLSVVKDVASVIGVAQPNTVFGGINSNRTMQEVLSLANEMAQRIAYDTREWNALVSLATYLGDGVTEAFPMPADYKRMLLKSEVWRSTSYLQPMSYIADINEWIQRRAMSRNTSWGEWIRIGGQMHIWPIMGSDLTATVRLPQQELHQSRREAAASGDSFVSRTTTVLCSTSKPAQARHDLSVEGQQWRSPYSEDMGSYGDALMMAMAADRPGPDTGPGDRPRPAPFGLAYPWPVPT